MTTVTRFAPSPTGYLHIGGARTALFNWLLARKTSGRFILRIEDTDQRRSTDESTRMILEDINWLGLIWDEGPEVGGANGPYFQSQRLEIYRKCTDQLIAAGRAYKSFETAEELEAAREEARKAGKGFKYDGRAKNLTPEQIRQYETEGRPFVVRLATTGEDVTVNDMILGQVVFKAEELEDFVILKSDGFPTYHLGVVVDDHLMGVTHVLRGQEHLMNTPKHIALQRALGFPTPIYAHLPLIFNMDGSKMSKRDKEKAAREGRPAPEIDVHDFRLAGYLPEALLNFVALLGWSPGGDREIMSLSEMTQLFSIERIGKTNARFDREKLAAFNAEYIRSVPLERLREAMRDFLALTDYPLKAADDGLLDRILVMYRERAKTLAEIAQKSRMFFVEQVEYDEKAVAKVLKKDPASKVLADMAERLAGLEAWTAANIHQAIETYAAENELNMGKVAQPLRVAVSGETVSPPIDQTIEALGKDVAIARIQQAQTL
ncbi:MAG: glutamate--tRNA ligase [Phycisphaerae bacterium]|nr:glutamate--tRNA ligase [Phycisphaerae bacterium]